MVRVPIASVGRSIYWIKHIVKTVSYDEISIKIIVASAHHIVRIFQANQQSEISDCVARDADHEAVPISIYISFLEILLEIKKPAFYKKTICM